VSSKDLRSLSDPSGALDLLRKIIDDSVRLNAFPSEAAIRAQVAGPWLVDDLLRAGLLASSGSFLVPTIEGLKAVQTPAADKSLKEARQIFSRLRELYVELPHRHQESWEIARHLGFDTNLVGRLIAQLTASASIASTWSPESESWRAVSILLSDRVLSEDPFRAASGETPGASPCGSSSSAGVGPRGRSTS